MTKIHGTFYFKLTDAGNLIGEYSNQTTERGRPESAYRNNTFDQIGFPGEYISTWFEPDPINTSVVARLTIAPKNSSTGQLVLDWKSLDNSKDLFHGEAMLCDGILIGNYHS